MPQEPFIAAGLFVLIFLSFKISEAVQKRDFWNYLELEADKLRRFKTPNNKIVRYFQYEIWENQKLL